MYGCDKLLKAAFIFLAIGTLYYVSCIHEVHIATCTYDKILVKGPQMLFFFFFFFQVFSSEL